MQARLHRVQQDATRAFFLPVPLPSITRQFFFLDENVRDQYIDSLSPNTAPVDDLTVSIPVYARWGFEYWQQLPDARIVLGGFRDLGGDEEWTTTNKPSDVVQQALETFLRRHLGVQSMITHRWAGLVSFSQTALPIIEEVRPNLWAIGAYSGTGNVIGALCGRGVAHLAFGEDSELIKPFRT
jgi:glycine/D-amino acid oxidase-like deaminating enzyme